MHMIFHNCIHCHLQSFIADTRAVECPVYKLMICQSSVGTQGNRLILNSSDDDTTYLHSRRLGTCAYIAFAAPNNGVLYFFVVA